MADDKWSVEPGDPDEVAPWTSGPSPAAEQATESARRRPGRRAAEAEVRAGGVDTTERVELTAPARIDLTTTQDPTVDLTEVGDARVPAVLDVTDTAPAATRHDAAAPTEIDLTDDAPVTYRTDAPVDDDAVQDTLVDGHGEQDEETPAEDTPSPALRDSDLSFRAPRSGWAAVPSWLQSLLVAALAAVVVFLVVSYLGGGLG